jgi:prepilin-type N-terminal cleavage/methylation domain-containing protein
MDRSALHPKGFTLIELSIVLVIIGLIVGGVLVGQNLIAAAGVRATVAQIEKYNTAASTFREKYGYLPGDIPAVPAIQFGFIARGTTIGKGDGNGVIEAGVFSATNGSGLAGGGGEELVFWVDLSTARLIDGGFSSANFSGNPGSVATGAVLDQYLPQAKLGNGNYIYVFSGGWGNNSGLNSNGVNYYGLSNVFSLGQSNCTTCLISYTLGGSSNPGLTVQQAYSIDQKIDDGLPLTGNVLAAYLSSNNWFWGNKQTNNSAPPLLRRSRPQPRPALTMAATQVIRCNIPSPSVAAAT